MRTTRLAPEGAVKAERKEIKRIQTRGEARFQRKPETDDYASALNDPPDRPKAASKEKLKDRLSNDNSRGLNASSSSIYIPEPSVPPVEATVTKKHKPQRPRVVITEKEVPQKESPEPPKVVAEEQAKPESVETQRPEVLEPLLVEKEKPQAPLLPNTELKAKPVEVKVEPEQPKIAPAAKKLTVIAEPEDAEVVAEPKVDLPEPSPPKLKKPPKFTVVETSTEVNEQLSVEPQETIEDVVADETQIVLFDDMPTPPATPAPVQEEKADYAEDAFDRFIRSKNDDLNF